MDEQLITATRKALAAYSCKFTMDDIARSLHISKATLYQKAPSKEALIGMVEEDRMKRFGEEEAEVLRGSRTTEGKVLSYVEIFVRCFWGLPDRVYQDLEIHYPALWEKWFAFRKQKFGDMMKLLEESVEKGELRAVNLPVLRLILMSSCRALNDPEFLAEENMTGADVMKALEDIILKGIQIRK